MSVSIVIPAHNAGVFIIETIRSILANVSVLEVIIVDDGSSDATTECVRSLAKDECRLSLIRCDSNRGAGVARNVGCAAVRGEFTIFLDADDFLVPGAIDELYAAISCRSADVAVFRYRYCTQGPDDATTTHASEQRFWETVPAAAPLHQTDFASICGILTTQNVSWNKIIRTSYLRRIVLRFSETFSFNDVLAHWTIYLNAPAMILYNKVLVFHKINPQGPVQLSTSSNRRCLDVFRAFEDVEMLFEANPACLKYYHYFLYFKLETLAHLVLRLPDELLAEFHAAITSSYRRLDAERLGLVTVTAAEIAQLSLQARNTPEALFPAPVAPRSAPAANAAPAPIRPDHAFNSKIYWEQRYRDGGTSGAGSRGRLAEFKADVLNALVRTRGIDSMIEFGCGDGDQLAKFNVPRYTGIDVSDTIVARCRRQFEGAPNRSFYNYTDPLSFKTADMAISLDVIYHLTEDEVFERYMHRLFIFGRRYVVIYSSSVEAEWPNRHVRHRNVLAHVETFFPDWILEEHIPNLYPYDPNDPNMTSFSDFFVFTNPWANIRRDETPVASQPSVN